MICRFAPIAWFKSSELLEMGLKQKVQCLSNQSLHFQVWLSPWAGNAVLMRVVEFPMLQLTALSSLSSTLTDQRTFSYAARMMTSSSCTASSGQWWHLWWACSLWSWPFVPRAWRSRQKPWRSASSPNGKEDCGKPSAEAVPSGQRSPAPQSPHLVAQEMEGAAAGLREAPSSVVAETGTAGRVGNLSPVSPVL